MRYRLCLFAAVCWGMLCTGNAQAQGTGGYALEFNGTNQYVQVAHSSSLNLSGSLTIEAWVNKYADVYWASILTKGEQIGVNTCNYSLHFTDTGSVVFTGEQAVYSHLKFASHEWHHVAVTWDGHNIVFYIDGVQDSIYCGDSMTLVANNHRLMIGVDFPGDAEYFPGQLDEVRLWNVARSKAEILQYKNKPLDLPQTGLVGYWKFDEHGGSVAHDSSGGGHDGTLINVPLWVSSSAPLPIQLAAFSGCQHGLSAVSLSWSTISENQNYGFIVERRKDSESNFRELPGSFVPGNGTTLVPHDYAFEDSDAAPGTYYYRIRQVDGTGEYSFSPVIKIVVNTLFGVMNDEMPGRRILAQNYPNPFNPSTAITYYLTQERHVRISVYNSLGVKVRTLVDGTQPAGLRSVEFNGDGLPSGLYHCHLEAGAGPGSMGQISETIRMVLVR